MPIVSTVRGSFGPQGRFGRVRFSATGGTVTSAGGYTIHTFLLADSGTNFTATGSGTVEYLVIAGGGGGGTQGGEGGGGGAGGFRTGSLTVSGAIPVTVGDGGLARATWTTYTVATADNKGKDSVFSSITSIGGGAGGSHDSGGVNIPAGCGQDGGSGGGGGGNNVNTAGQQPGQGTAGQGYAGGLGYNNGSPYRGGGGGGAGQVGEGASSGTRAGKGGDGLASSLSGTSRFYAGGGGGSTNGGLPGFFGNGNNSTPNNSGAAGEANTGGGGGSGGGQTGSGNNCKGGSGLVIVRYLT